MQNPFSRTEQLLGKAAMEKLAASHVLLFGLGGVGGFVAEALVRSGLGKITLVDHDTVDITNINRQIYATYPNIGRQKVAVAKERILLINPDIQIQTYPIFYTPESADVFEFSDYDYVIDAIDTVTAKIDLAVRCYHANTPLISAMGAGNKLDPTAFEVADIYQTSVCPLARVMRYELKKRKIPRLKVVYSKEKPITPAFANREGDVAATRRSTPGSAAFVPSVAGLILAGEVIKDLTQMH